ncbi:2-aminoethylphosphonate--pyruvate transaminase [Paenibacillus sp. J22TS3]|uniref:2-aminoethylphosphonate--pyruvate transaminase n=1 Tax=Paenibacillus sp. J22TS3 TaxID=2807192 RepID=UPI001B0B4BF0|nr:2-aminoethylphosphonate--pyruvate transaminase [Paenibacillus sp. J22TS3]GIP23884.1 2-aminoethylphosphonate--pyruvate transaminase [Paenibacillus sp. J22TS3]
MTTASSTNQTALGGNPYLLLTPGPLSTSKTVKEAMLRDWCTWDKDYNELVQSIQSRLVELAGAKTDEYTAVLMQGSGTFSVEAVISTVMPSEGKLLILTNGAYGNRIAEITHLYNIEATVLDFGEVAPVSPEAVDRILAEDQDITHVIFVHCETTTGMLNPIHEITSIAKRYGKTIMVDAMSSFGGIPLNIQELHIDYLISSANKCIQGVPGFGFILARTNSLKMCKGQARTVSLDLYSQWETMEKGGGKWRYTSPTHVVRAFDQALKELAEEGGVEARYARYKNNQQLLVNGMTKLGVEALLQPEVQSPFITAFQFPQSEQFSFEELYTRMKLAGYVIYPGKISAADTFRIGSIGEVYPEDIENLLQVIADNRFW